MQQQAQLFNHPPSSQQQHDRNKFGPNSINMMFDPGRQLHDGGGRDGGVGGGRVGGGGGGMRPGAHTSSPGVHGLLPGLQAGQPAGSFGGQRRLGMQNQFSLFDKRRPGGGDGVGSHWNPHNMPGHPKQQMHRPEAVAAAFAADNSLGGGGGSVMPSVNRIGQLTSSSFNNKNNNIIINNNNEINEELNDQVIYCFTYLL